METIETLNKEPIKQKNRPSVPRWVWIVWPLSIILAILATCLYLVFGQPDEQSILRYALETVRNQFYFYDASEDVLVDGAIRGMADSLGDVYSTYYTSEEYAELTKTNSGRYTGVGFVVQQEDVGVFSILDVYPNTPAEEAGVLAGDELLAINGTSGEGLDIGTFLSYVNREDGAENELLLRRNGETFTVVATSREVYAPTVVGQMLTETIGYLHLSSFHGDCVTEVKEMIEDLWEGGMQALIFDVRDNPGGSLTDVCDIADLFLDKGLVITSLRSRTEKQVQYKSEHGGYTFPLVLLVNGNSASASELLSGALKDHGRAYLVGTQTFGKGIVQSYCYIPGTGGYLKLTTEAYYTPNDVCIQGVGITPDLILDNPEEAKRYSIDSIPQDLDEQLQAAIQYLENAGY